MYIYLCLHAPRSAPTPPRGGWFGLLWAGTVGRLGWLAARQKCPGVSSAPCGTCGTWRHDTMAQWTAPKDISASRPGLQITHHQMVLNRNGDRGEMVSRNWLVAQAQARFLGSGQKLVGSSPPPLLISLLEVPGLATAMSERRAPSSAQQGTCPLLLTFH